MHDPASFDRALKRRQRRYRAKGRPRRAELGLPLFAAGCLLLFALAVWNPERVPAPVQGLISASRNMGREHSPPVGAYYANCDAARAAGVAPIYSGEPGYREELDGDLDGIACEPYRGR
jgi:hypothetical protein